MKPCYQFKRQQPTASPWSKRQHYKREVFVGKTEEITKKPESPIKGEQRPAYHIDFHARERRGKCWLSYTMNLSPIEMGVIIAKFICDAHVRFNYDPRKMAQAVVNAVEEGMTAYEQELKRLTEKVNNE